MPDCPGRKKHSAGKNRAAIHKTALAKKTRDRGRLFRNRPSISTVATWEWDIAAGVCHYSDEWADIIGEDCQASAQMKNWAWWSGRMHMDDMPGVLETHKKFLEGNITESEVLYRLRRPDGRWVRILSRGAVSQWKDDGTPAVMFGLSIDISHLAMDPPLPENDAAGSDMPAPRARKGTAETFTALSPDAAVQRSLLNERRLAALYQLTQMEKASEEEVLHFAVTSILQLTNSANGFLFVFDAKEPGKGLFFRIRGQYTSSCLLREASDTLPEDLAHLVSDPGLNLRESRIVNGDGINPATRYQYCIPVMRYIIAPGVEGERIVCLAGVSNKPSDYDESDLRQIETFINNVWLILQRRRRTAELELAKTAAEAADKAKGEFLANISHELRTPLNGILSMLQLLESVSMTDQEREFLDAARFSGNALVRIISDILDFSRIESGKMPLEKELFDFKTSVLSCLRIFREEAETRNLAFVTVVDPAIPDVLRGDDTRIRQIIFNLVGNALKFTGEGGITVSCALASEPREGKAALRIRVADTGVGIPKDKQGTLFNAFMRVDTFFTKKHSGTGLGLSIVKRLVDMMEGEIHLDSEPGKGTTITCTIVLEVPAQTEKTIEIAHPVDEYNQEPLDILVAEDDAVGRFAIRAFLLRDGHRVVCVQNGRQALEALQIYPFDCLLTDIQMPDMDGLELVRSIQGNRARDFLPSSEIRSLVRETFPGTPEVLVPVDPNITIVAVSAHTMAGDRERFLQQGIDYYIAKPIAMQQLNDVLRKVPKRTVSLRKLRDAFPHKA